MNTLVQQLQRKTKTSETPTTLNSTPTNSAMIIELPAVKKTNNQGRISTKSIGFMKYIHPNADINRWTVMWEFSLDLHFRNIVNSIHIQQNIEQAQVIKVELINVPADIQIYQRLTCTDCMALELTQNDMEVSQHYTLPANIPFPTRSDTYGSVQASSLQ